jgi:2'-5' RNA ligase
MIRTFLAIQPSPEVLETLETFAGELRKTGGDVRWIKGDSMHLTIKFLGDVPEREIGGLSRALEERFVEQAPIDVEFRGIGVFPNMKKPRVLWVGLHGGGLGELVERAETALSPLGFPPEEREFTPHLTIGRFRSTRGWERLLAAIKDARDQSFGVGQIAKATLYQSDLRADGPVYTALTEFSFGPGA